MRYLILLVVVALSGCGMMGGGLEDRAADYYNFMVGNKPNVKYSSYISPAYRGVFAKEDLKAFNEAMSPGDTASTHHGVAAAEDVFVAQQDKFAITLIDPDKGRAFRNIEPTKWVKAGNRWYLYFGSDAEISRYGPFPESLRPPVPVRAIPEDAAGTVEGGESGLAGAE